jgi:hypothetical protein
MFESSSAGFSMARRKCSLNEVYAERESSRVAVHDARSRFWKSRNDFLELAGHGDLRWDTVLTFQQIDLRLEAMDDSWLEFQMASCRSDMVLYVPKSSQELLWI